MKTRVDEHKAMQVVWSLKEIEYNLARKRHAQQGRIEIRNGAYWLRYYRDELHEGKIHRARPRQFLGYTKQNKTVDKKLRITETEAKQKARDFLSEIDKPNARPTAMMTLKQYVLGSYQTRLAATSKNHQLGFESGMNKHILDALGDKQLRDITNDDAQALMNALVKSGKSSSTVRHQRAYLGAVMNHARKQKIIAGDSVTAGLMMPSKKKKKNPTPPLTFEQTAWILTRLPQPYQAMCALSCCTSSGYAEMAGLRIVRLNLTSQIKQVADKFMPPLSAWIAENYSYCDREGDTLRKDFRDTKNEYRDRIIPIPAALVPLLQEVLSANPLKGPNDPVFQSRTGNPVDGNNANNRLFRPLRHALGVKVSWNSFRHTFGTLSEDLAIRDIDKKAFMGHSQEADITNVYTSESWPRMMAIANALAERFGIESLVKDKERTACPKVVSIR